MIKNFILKQLGLIVGMVVLSLLNLEVSAQAVVVAGTTFTPTTVIGGKTYYGITDIDQYGMITGNIVVTPPITPNTNANVFNGSPYYGITTNPANLDNVRYWNLPAATNYMLVASSAASTPSNLLSYTVPGLLPGSNVTAKITYCNVISPSYATCSPGEIVSLRGVLNPDAGNTLNGLEGSQLHAGNCLATDLVLTQSTSNSQVVPASGTVTFNVNNQQTGSCKAVAISKIEIIGIPQPLMISSEGSSVCAGEQSILSLKQNYDASAIYQWKVNTGSGFTNIAGATNSAYLLTAAASGTNYQYQVTVTYAGTTYTTPATTLSSITCCGTGGSRKTIFYDDFGTLDLTADPTGKTYYVWDYTNPVNPVQVQKTTTTAWRWTEATPPPGTTFSSSGVVDNNQYTVAAGLTGYSAFGTYAGAALQWAGNVGGFTSQPNPAFDHSGNFPGAAMFLNVPAHTQNSIIYSRTINNLCGGKQIFFEAWINVFTSSAPGTYHPVNIAVKLIDGSNAANFTTANATATRQADGGGYWVEITGTLTLGGASTSLIMQLYNNQDDDGNGDDLVLDDIRVLACSAPNINIVFDKTTLTTTEDECTADMNLYSLYPASFPAFYGGSPRYLFQYTYTPTNNTSWVTIGTPQVADFYTMTSPKTNAIFTGIPAGKTQVYFRVISATAATFTANSNFTGTHYASQSDVCQNYSVSTAIAADIVCPLPIELISFTGQKTSSANVLNWSTISEKDNDYFVLERSTNGKDFIAIATIEGNGTSTSGHSYQFIDNNPPSENVYYRLKQVDFNGTYHFSNVIVIEASKTEDVFIYPNPNNGSFNISFMNAGQSYILDITDLTGRQVYHGIGETTGSMELDEFVPGLYIVKATINDQVVVKKVEVY
jgi:hypothetical protein